MKIAYVGAHDAVEVDELDATVERNGDPIEVADKTIAARLLADEVSWQPVDQAAKKLAAEIAKARDEAENGSAAAAEPAAADDEEAN